jgi:hypothetical protein
MEQIEPREAGRNQSNHPRDGHRVDVLTKGLPITTMSPAQTNRGAQEAARARLLARLHHQPASGEARSWRRDDLYE